ncbi:MAG: glycosyltransferase family 39 protein [Lewinella sp.]|nr:glycosyltransferase family 39 protein [Lewinella sp.]
MTSLKNRFSSLSQPLAFALTIGIWAFAAWLVNPSGEFPLNDDWAYSEVVRGVLTDGKYRVSDWPAMTLWTHVWLGVLLCKIAGGFSLALLRYMVLALGLGGVLLFGWLAGRLCKNTMVSFVAMLALAFNPMYFSLSYTYMTDVSFLFFFFGGAAFYLKVLETDKTFYWAGAILFSVFGILIRQFALLLPFCFGITALLQQYNRRRLALAILGFGVTWGALKLYTVWLSSVQQLPSSFGDLGNLSGWLNIRTVYFHFLERMGGFLFLLGLFLFPFHFLVLPRAVQKAGKFRAALIGFLSVALAVFFSWRTWDNALFGNILYNLGLGPVVLKDYDMGLARGTNMPDGIWRAIRLMACAGAAAMVFNIISLLVNYLKTFSFKIHSTTRAFKIAIALFGTAYFIFLFLGWANFDRYYLPLIPCLLLLILSPVASRFERWWGLPALFCFAPFAWYAVAGTHDYLGWNRARWALLDETMEKDGISPLQIDGGFEFNAALKTHIGNPNTKTSAGVRAGISRWFVADDQYVITTGQLPCYQPWKVREYQAWIPGRKEYIHMLERPPFAASDTIFFDGEAVADSNWAHSPVLFGLNGLEDAQHTRSGRRAWVMKEGAEFAADSYITGVGPCDWITITAWRWGKSPAAGIVAATPEQRAFYAFEIYPPLYEPVEGDWYRVRMEITLPEDYPTDTLRFYLWDHTKEPVWFDDFQVIRRLR